MHIGLYNPDVFVPQMRLRKCVAGANLVPKMEFPMLVTDVEKAVSLYRHKEVRKLDLNAGNGVALKVML